MNKASAERIDLSTSGQLPIKHSADVVNRANQHIEDRYTQKQQPLKAYKIRKQQLGGNRDLNLKPMEQRLSVADKNYNHQFNIKNSDSHFVQGVNMHANKLMEDQNALRGSQESKVAHLESSNQFADNDLRCPQQSMVKSRNPSDITGEYNLDQTQ